MTTPTTQELLSDLHAAANALLQTEAGKIPREDVPLTDIAQTIRQAIGALAVPPSAGAGAQEAVPGSDVLCESCARVFCPHEDRLHFDKDGCPSCEELDGPAPPTPPPDTLDREALVKLAEEWRANADMLAVGNKSEHYDPSVGMQRACADQLLARLRAQTPTGELK